MKAQDHGPSGLVTELCIMLGSKAVFTIEKSANSFCGVGGCALPVQCSNEKKEVDNVWSLAYVKVFSAAIPSVVVTFTVRGLCAAKSFRVMVTVSPL